VCGRIVFSRNEGLPGKLISCQFCKNRLKILRKNKNTLVSEILKTTRFLFLKKDKKKLQQNQTEATTCSRPGLDPD